MKILRFRENYTLQNEVFLWHSSCWVIFLKRTEQWRTKKVSATLKRTSGIISSFAADTFSTVQLYILIKFLRFGEMEIFQRSSNPITKPKASSGRIENSQTRGTQELIKTLRQFPFDFHFLNTIYQFLVFFNTIILMFSTFKILVCHFFPAEDFFFNLAKIRFFLVSTKVRDMSRYELNMRDFFRPTPISLSIVTAALFAYLQLNFAKMHSCFYPQANDA